MAPLPSVGTGCRLNTATSSSDRRLWREMAWGQTRHGLDDPDEMISLLCDSVSPQVKQAWQYS